MDLDQDIDARNGLIVKDLIAINGTVFQVLELPATPVLSATKSQTAHQPSQSVTKADGAMNRQTTDESVVIALEKTIKDHLEWMASQDYAQSTQDSYRWRLTQFTDLIKSGNYDWEDIFTLTAINRFKGHPGSPAPDQPQAE